jgi:D-alanine transaminase
VKLVEENILRLIEHTKVNDGLVYCQISRGNCKRQHAFPPPDVKPNELIYIDYLKKDPFEDYRENGVFCITHPDLRWKRRDIKTTNLLGNCLAKQAADEQGCQEAILVEDGWIVTEGSHNNVFMVKDDCIFTHPQGSAILPGVTSAFVLGLIRELDVPFEAREYSIDFLKSADEIFLTGTTAEVLPVTRLDHRPVGQGKPGPVATQLATAFLEKIRSWRK